MLRTEAGAEERIEEQEDRWERGGGGGGGVRRCRCVRGREKGEMGEGRMRSKDIFELGDLLWWWWWCLARWTRVVRERIALIEKPLGGGQLCQKQRCGERERERYIGRRPLLTRLQDQLTKKES